MIEIRIEGKKMRKRLIAALLIMYGDEHDSLCSPADNAGGAATG